MTYFLSLLHALRITSALTTYSGNGIWKLLKCPWLHALHFPGYRIGLQDGRPLRLCNSNKTGLFANVFLSLMVQRELPHGCTFLFSFWKQVLWRDAFKKKKKKWPNLNCAVSNPQGNLLSSINVFHEMFLSFLFTLTVLKEAKQRTVTLQSSLK